MTKIALVSDQHFDASSRFDECIRVLNWIADDAKTRGVDVVALGGDLFERRPIPIEVKAAAEWLIRLGEFAPVVGVYGNHDVPESLAVLNKLDTKHPVFFHDCPGVDEVAGVRFACMPWPSKAGLAAMYPEFSRDELNVTAVGMLQNILRGLADELDGHDARVRGPRFFLGHCQVRASRVSTGQPLMGCDFELGVEDLALVRAHFYGLGHIHLGVGNEWDVAGAPACYPGSPRRTSYGELEDKGYVVAEFDGPRLVGWERVKTPCAPMLHLSGRFDGDLIDIPAEQRELVDETDGAEIRLRYKVEADQQAIGAAAADRLAAWLKDKRGAIAVKVEAEVITTKRSRSPEVARAHSIGDKLEAHWRSTSFDPGSRREALLAKAARLEEECRNG